MDFFQISHCFHFPTFFNTDTHTFNIEALLPWRQMSYIKLTFFFNLKIVSTSLTTVLCHIPVTFDLNCFFFYKNLFIEYDLQFFYLNPSTYTLRLRNTYRHEGRVAHLSETFLNAYKSNLRISPPSTPRTGLNLTRNKI